jgi:hypothetical protein
MGEDGTSYKSDIAAMNGRPARLRRRRGLGLMAAGRTHDPAVVRGIAYLRPDPKSGWVLNGSKRRFTGDFRGCFTYVTMAIEDIRSGLLPAIGA